MIKSQSSELTDGLPPLNLPSMRLIHHAQSNISVMMQHHKPSQTYDPFKCPPDLNEAKLHGQARRVCKPTKYMKDGLKTDRIDNISQLSSLDEDELSISEQKVESNKVVESKEIQSNHLFSERQGDKLVGVSSFEQGSQPFGHSNNKLEIRKVSEEQEKKISHQLERKQQLDGETEGKKCPCCGFLIDNELIPINCNNIDFLHLGITYPLYFDFIRQCALLLTIHFFISSIPSIIINVGSNQCESYNDSSFVCVLSFLNILQSDKDQVKIKNLKAENLCNCIFLLISMIMISIFKIQQKIKKQKLETFHCSISDFSIFITRLPQEFEMQELEKFLQMKVSKLEKQFEDVSELDIIKSYKLYDLQHYALLCETKAKLNKRMIKIKRKLVLLKLEEKKLEPKIGKDSLDFNVEKNLREPLNEDLANIVNRDISQSSSSQHDNVKQRQTIDKYRNVVAKIVDFQQEIKQIEYQLKQTEKDLIDFEKLLLEVNTDQQDDQQKIMFSKRAIITFNSFDVAKKIRHSFKMTLKEKFFSYFRFLFPKTSRRVLKDHYFKDKFIKIRRAPEPTDILWTNIGSTRKKWKFVIASHILVYLLILVSFCALLILKKLIKREQNVQPQLVSLLLSFTASTVVALFNSLLGKKLTKMFIVNMVISTLMSNMVNYFISSQKEFPFDAQGLMNDFFFLFITNSYIGSIFNVFDIMWALRLIKRYRAEKDSSMMTQMEANDLFEGHPIDMALRYANVNKTVLFTASVSPFIPIGVPLSIIGLAVTYWVDKYLLLRRYVCKNYLSYDLAKYMLNSFKIYAVYFSFGNMLTMFMPVSKYESTDESLQHFIWPQRQNSVFFYVSILGFLLALAFRYFPLKGLADLYNRVFKEKYRKRQIKTKYQEIKDELLDDYDFYHPIFKDNSAKVEEQDVRKDSTHSKLSIRPKNYSGVSEYSQMFKSIQNQVDFHQKQ